MCDCKAGEEGISTSEGHYGKVCDCIRWGREEINQCRTLCKVSECMAGEEGISTSEGHYVRCVIVWLWMRGYQPMKDTEVCDCRCVTVWLGKGDINQ